MRQIILDTETTGLEHEEGHRIIEIGCLEMIDRRLTGRQFHEYINPERDVESGALNVHGLTNEFLQDKPRFADISDDLIEFIRDAELVIHNAAFDVGFLDAEFARLEAPVHTDQVAQILDTLQLARELHPGQRVSLDALCKRYEVDNSNRTLHGALLDSELLAEVYLLMTGGQVAMALDLAPQYSASSNSKQHAIDPELICVHRASAEEQAAHQVRLQQIDEAAGDRGCLWLKLQTEG